MGHSRSVGLAVAVGWAVSACAPLPRIYTSHTCNGNTSSQLVVRAVDAAGKDVPFAPVFVTSDDRSTRVTTSTSSLGSVKLPLRAGSYRVAVAPLVAYCVLLWGVGVVGGYLLAYRGLGPYAAQNSPAAFWLASTFALGLLALILPLILWRAVRRYRPA